MSTTSVEAEITETETAKDSNLKFTKTLLASKVLMGKSLKALKKSSTYAWHAYLGTAATAEESTVKFVKSMVEKGATVDETARAKMAKGMEALTGSTKSAREKITSLSKDKVITIEKYVGRKFRNSLHTAGVPTTTDLEQLTEVMTEMSKAIEELSSMTESTAKSKRSRAASS